MSFYSLIGWEGELHVRSKLKLLFMFMLFELNSIVFYGSR